MDQQLSGKRFQRVANRFSNTDEWAAEISKLFFYDISLPFWGQEKA